MPSPAQRKAQAINYGKRSRQGRRAQEVLDSDSEVRKSRLDYGKKSAQLHIQATMENNRRNQTTDSNNE